MDMIDFRTIEPLRDIKAVVSLSLLIAQIKGPKKVAVAAAADPHVLEAINEARIDGMISAQLYGDANQILAICRQLKIDPSKFEITDASSNDLAAELAVKAVSEGRADILMKGLLDTAVILRAVLNKDWGLRSGKQLSHVLVYDTPLVDYGRLFMMSDGAMNIEPDLKAKIAIVENTVTVAHCLGVMLPKVAMLAAVEVVNPDMSTAVDDAIISKMGDRGQIKGAIIDGPLALDNAISEESAKIKKINSPVAGKADILIVDNIDVGNVLYKTLVYFAKARVAGVIMGATAPFVLTSRADSEETKYHSLALACVLAERMPYI